MNKYISNLSIASVALVITACGGSSNNNDDNDVVVANPTIRGVINSTLPSATLPSNTLASNSLPSIEVDESPVAIAEVRTLNVTMQSDQEVSVEPLAAVNVDFTATAEVVVNETTGAITATVTASNLDDGDEILMVHIHSAFAGSNGPVIVGLEATDDPLVYTLNTTIADTGSDLETFLSGGWYLNLHTESNPGGQLRGQLVTDDADVVRVEMSSEQEVLTSGLSESRSTSGVAYFTYDTDTSNDTVIANLQTVGFEATVAHIHAGIAGQNGPVIIPLNDISTNITDAATGTFWTTDPSATFINRTNTLNGFYYFNAHSVANPGGEVRGQILPGDANVERIVLQTAQEIPAVVTPSAANVGGVAYITTNGDNFIGANVQVDGFTPVLEGAPSPVHIHTGFAGEAGPITVVLNEVATINDADGNAVENTFYRATAASATAAAFVAADFNAGRNYINVHSEANASGEIRGQATPTGVQAVITTLQGQQENPPVENAAGVSGTGYVTFNSENETIVANVRVAGFVPELNTPAGTPAPIGPVHIHNGFAGVNAPVVLPLSPVGESGLIFRGTEADILSGQTLDFSQLLQGGHYINVHSAANGSGEIRGQIVPSNSTVIRAELDGSQVLPAADTTTSATGIGYLTITDLINGQFLSNVTVSGLEQPSVVLNIGGNNNVFFIELTPATESPNSFSSPVGPVANLNGLLNGAYSFQAEGEQ